MSDRVFPVSSYEALIDATGTQALGDVILAIADAQIGVDEVFGYWIDAAAAPVQIASSGRTGSSLARASLYSSRFHAMDPLAALIHLAQEGAPTQHGHVVARDIGDATYRRECFDKPGLAEKFTFVRTRSNRHYVLSFYRAKGRRPVTKDAFRDLVEMTFPVLRKQVDLLGEELDISLTQRAERRIGKAYPGLTVREREVCARTLIGMTAEATAIDLGISGATVLTYRRRAYDRYRISGIGQMMDKLLS